MRSTESAIKSFISFTFSGCFYALTTPFIPFDSLLNIATRNSSNFRNDCGFEIQEIAKSASKKFNGRHQTVGIIIILSLCHTKQKNYIVCRKICSVGLYFCCCFLLYVCSCYCWFVFFFFSFLFSISISFFIWKLNYPKRTCSTKWITCSSYRCWEEFLKLIV